VLYPSVVCFHHDPLLIAFTFAKPADAFATSSKDLDLPVAIVCYLPGGATLRHSGGIPSSTIATPIRQPPVCGSSLGEEQCFPKKLRKYGEVVRGRRDVLHGRQLFASRCACFQHLLRVTPRSAALFSRASNQMEFVMALPLYLSNYRYVR